MSQESDGQATDAWLATLDLTASEVSHDEALTALDAVREEPATRHG